MRTDKEWTQYWHDNAIGMWNRWIDPTQHKHALEVGSFEGASAVWLLDTIPELEITCVDIFASCFDDTTGEYESRFDRNVAEYGNRVTKLKGHSQDALRTFSKNSEFDLIYIDGHHSYDAVKQDAELAWPLLSVGGLMIFDDYDNVEFGVRQAVDEFLGTVQVQVLREPGDYQMAFIKQVQ